ncbi:MAG: MFS transporter [Chlamydiales bacterium]|nr:MFS transporter [Chlamydiia bacterium]MCP5504499.1 MFS transporter [Chlamydiales bacterium]
MRKVFRGVFAPLLSLVIVMLGNGFFTTFTSLRFSVEGYPNFVVGVLGGAYYLGMMLGALYVERLISRIGHIRSFAMMASINSVIIVIQSFYIDPYSWTFYRILTGFCTSGFFIAIESWLLLSSGLRSRGKLLSLYMLTLYLAQGFGQFLLNASPIQSLIPFAITVILSSLSVIPVSMMRSSGPVLLESAITNVFQIIKRSPLGPIGCFVSGLMMSSFYGLAPIFAREIHLSLFQISQVMGFTIMGGLLLQWPIGHLSDIFNRRKVIIGVAFALMLVTFALYHSSNFHYYLLLALMVLFGGISFTLYPLAITYTCDHFSDKKVIGITCALLLVYGVGCIVGPLISPFFMSYFGPSGLFLYMSILCALYIVICMWRVLHSKPLSEEEQSDYLPLPRATSIALYLDPKSDFGEEEELDEDDEDLYPFSEEYEDEDED